MKIPKQFQLIDSIFRVKRKNKLSYASDNKGEIRYRSKQIIIQKSSKDNYLSKSSEEQVFLHELTHAILDTMGEEELRKNEKFVELFSKLLHQYHQTKK